jgi:hypothetical protein
VLLDSNTAERGVFSPKSAPLLAIANIFPGEPARASLRILRGPGFPAPSGGRYGRSRTSGCDSPWRRNWSIATICCEDAACRKEAGGEPQRLPSYAQKRPSIANVQREMA